MLCRGQTFGQNVDSYVTAYYVLAFGRPYRHKADIMQAAYTGSVSSFVPENATHHPSSRYFLRQLTDKLSVNRYHPPLSLIYSNLQGDVKLSAKQEFAQRLQAFAIRPEPVTMSTTLHDRLKQRVASEGADRILRAMGYSERALAHARDRLQNVLADPDLGLGAGRYDFRFSNREFLRALAGAVAVDAKETERRIDDIERELQHLRKLFKPWIFVDTQFKRSGEPIFVLAWTEHMRRLRLPVKARLLSRNELTRFAGERVREHHRENQGRLLVWGVISEYKLVVSETEQVVMDREGNALREEPLRLGGSAVMTFR